MKGKERECMEDENEGDGEIGNERMGRLGDEREEWKSEMRMINQ